MSAVIAIAAQWLRGFAILRGGSIAAGLVGFACFAPEARVFREAAMFLFIVAAIIGGMSFGIYTLGGWFS